VCFISQVTIDTVMNTLVLMGAMPEIGTPTDETHIVRSTAVLRHVRYGRDVQRNDDKDGVLESPPGLVLVSYESFDSVSTEKIRVESNALLGGGGVTVTIDGEELPRLPSLASMASTDVRGGGAWALDEATGVMEVSRNRGGRVAVVRRS
jgi:hypothetical protein